MRSFAQAVRLSGPPDGNRAWEASTKAAAHDREPQPLPRFDWSFRKLALQSQRPSADAGTRAYGQPRFIVQPNLIVGPVDDPYEREADRVAAAVVRGSAASPADSTSGAPSGDRLQRKCAACEGGHKCDKCKEEEEGRIQKKSWESTGPASVSAVAGLDTSGGSRMSPSVRSRIEPVLGADLSHVRIHADRSAHDTARALRARAFTHANHIWLGKGESAEDLSLMAHESTHVLQQSSKHETGIGRMSLTNRMVQRSPFDKKPERELAGGPLVVMPDAPGVKNPVMVTATKSVALDDQDSKRSRSLPYSQIRESPEHVDNGIISVGADLSIIWTLSIKSLIFKYRDKRTTTVDVGDIDYTNTARVDAFVKRGGVIYPVRENGSIAYDQVNTPTIFLGAQLTAKQQTYLRRQNLQYAQMTFAFEIPIASLAGAAAGLPEEGIGGPGMLRGSRGTAGGRGGGAGDFEPPEPTPPESSPRFAGTSTGDIAIDPDVGLSRELRVAEELGGRVAKYAKSDIKFKTPGGDGVKVDVLGPNQELVVVGGPSKAARLSDLGGNLKRLKELADAHRVQALAYFEEGTPQSVLDVAIKWLGKGNVRTFK